METTFNVYSKCRISVLLFLIACPLYIMAQQIDGFVVDAEQKAIGGATVILQAKDSTFVESGITDEKGYFVLKNQQAAYHILIQHLAYFDKVVDVQGKTTPIRVVMKERNIELAGIDVLAKPPLVKLASNGAFVYNVSRLKETSAATNALEILDDVPGIIANNTTYNIAGASNTTILVNGRKTGMTADDLKSLLSQMSVDDVKNIEVYYNTPPQMRVSGPSINVILHRKRSEQTKLSGDLYTTAFLGRKYYQVGGFHMGIAQKRWSFDFGYGLSSLNKTNYSTEYSNHTIGNTLHSIAINSKVSPDLFSHRINGRFSYDFKNKAQLTLSYDVKFTARSIYTSIPMTDKGISHTESDGLIDGNETMQVATAEYTYKRLAIGGDAVMYDYSTTQDLKTTTDGKENDLTSDNHQKVRHGNFYISHSSNINGGVLNYGVSTSLSSSDNSFWNRWSNSMEAHNNKDNASRQNETSTDAFVTWTRKWGNKATLTAGFKTQYFHACLTSGGKKQKLWDEMDFYPTLNLNYNIAPSRALLLTLSSNRTYPSYYTTSESKRYHNTYKVDISNPSLKPYTTYELHLNHIWKGQYIVGAYATLRPKMFTHYTYQHPDELVVENGYYNCTQFSTYGIIAALPYNWSKRLQSKLTSDIYYRKMKGEYGDGNVKFDNDKIAGDVSLTNSLNLLRDKSLLVQLGATYSLPYVECTRNVSHVWNTNAAVSWNPKKSNFHVTLKASDLLNTYHACSYINTGGQNMADDIRNDLRAVNLNVRYVFRSFKQKKVRQVDTSRMTAEYLNKK